MTDPLILSGDPRVRPSHLPGDHRAYRLRPYQSWRPCLICGGDWQSPPSSALSKDGLCVCCFYGMVPTPWRELCQIVSTYTVTMDMILRGAVSMRSAVAMFRRIWPLDARSNRAIETHWHELRG